MTPAEMREAEALKALKAARDYAGLVEEDALRDIAAAIRALPLAEEALTPREKLRRVREARELLATARVAFVPRGAGFVTDEATWRRLGDWRPTQMYVLTKEKPWGQRPPQGCTVTDARTWVLDTLRAEGWDVVEEGEGDGDR